MAWLPEGSNERAGAEAAAAAEAAGAPRSPDPSPDSSPADGPGTAPVWRRRHYRVRRHGRETARELWPGEDPSSRRLAPPGVWWLSALDNGVVSTERWTLLDADDGSGAARGADWAGPQWCVLSYQGAARRAGTAYAGAVVCTRDGRWPSGPDGDGLASARQRRRAGRPPLRPGEDEAPGRIVRACRRAQCEGWELCVVDNGLARDGRLWPLLERREGRE